jgi:hypothetical protein
MRTGSDGGALGGLGRDREAFLAMVLGLVSACDSIAATAARELAAAAPRPQAKEPGPAEFGLLGVLGFQRRLLELLDRAAPAPEAAATVPSSSPRRHDEGLLR